MRNISETVEVRVRIEDYTHSDRIHNGGYLYQRRGSQGKWLWRTVPKLGFTAINTVIMCGIAESIRNMVRSNMEADGKTTPSNSELFNGVVDYIRLNKLSTFVVMYLRAMLEASIDVESFKHVLTTEITEGKIYYAGKAGVLLNEPEHVYTADTWRPTARSIILYEATGIPLPYCYNDKPVTHDDNSIINQRLPSGWQLLAELYIAWMVAGNTATANIEIQADRTKVFSDSFIIGQRYGHDAAVEAVAKTLAEGRYPIFKFGHDILRPLHTYAIQQVQERAKNYLAWVERVNTIADLRTTI